jgi:hypothetical protein
LEWIFGSLNVGTMTGRVRLVKSYGREEWMYVGCKKQDGRVKVVGNGCDIKGNG